LSATKPFAVFSQRKECQGGGLSLLADLTQGPIVPFWWKAGQQLSCASPVGHRLTGIGHHSCCQSLFDSKPRACGSLKPKNWSSRLRCLGDSSGDETELCSDRLVVLGPSALGIKMQFPWRIANLPCLGFR